MTAGQDNKGDATSNEHEVNGPLLDLLEHFFIVVDDDKCLDADQQVSPKKGKSGPTPMDEISTATIVLPFLLLVLLHYYHKPWLWSFLLLRFFLCYSYLNLIYLTCSLSLFLPRFLANIGVLSHLFRHHVDPNDPKSEPRASYGFAAFGPLIPATLN